jgi:hypothetical protein
VTWSRSCDEPPLSPPLVPLYLHNPRMTLQALPVPFGALPPAYGWATRSVSELSTTTAFNAGIIGRDFFLGIPRCIVCGYPSDLQHCYIIPLAEKMTTVGYYSRFRSPCLIGLFSGLTSGAAIGCLPRRRAAHTSHETASSCVPIITTPLPTSGSLFATFPR